MNDCAVINDAKKDGPKHQHHPEFTQSSYMRLRSLEEAFLMSNYLDALKGKTGDQVINAYDRSYGIQKIFDLHAKKDYKLESLFLAAGILDRYIYVVGPSNFQKSQMVCLATISVLLSAKIEQPISPSFTRMINLLGEEEKKYVSKKALIDLEANIIMTMGFDFNFPGPIQSMERYLRLLGSDLNKTIYDMAFQICKF